MEMRLTEKTPPAHAEYIGACRIETDDDTFPVVEVHWYPGERLRIQVKKGAPAVLEGAYLEGEGQDINLKIRK